MINTITMTHPMTITHTSRWEKKMYSDLENAMLKHMKKIVYQESRPFSFLDFMEFKLDDKPYSARRGTIRNKFSKFVKEVMLSYI